MRHLRTVSFPTIPLSHYHRLRLLDRREASAFSNRNAEGNLLGERWRGSTALFTPA
jgi:hypothetical protein